jgi:hypothetical protein
VGVSVDLGSINLRNYLDRSNGKVRGQVLTDAKIRWYEAEYKYQIDGSDLLISKVGGSSKPTRMPSVIKLDSALVAFFGLYSGDGSKGTDDASDPTRIRPNISFSQREKTLVRFAMDQFAKIFTGDLKFVFTLGEDSAYFMADEGLARITAYYKSIGLDKFPSPKNLSEVNANLIDADKRYLKEKRSNVAGTSEEHLAYYYQHKVAMGVILAEEKSRDLVDAGIELSPLIDVRASLRRPFKKGARKPGGSSRSDELQISELSGMGELFLKMMHSIEASLANDTQEADYGLITWNDLPSTIGVNLDVENFFKSHPYGAQRGGERPKIEKSTPGHLMGQWARSNEVRLKSNIQLSPLWAYVSGLYLAEGTTPKSELFMMFKERVAGMALGFTSSEGASIELLLRILGQLFEEKDCVTSWKIKVGSQYFTELVVIGLKEGVSMLRGGASGDGKTRSMEISLALKPWAIAVANADLDGRESLLASRYAGRFSHVEPTGAGVARIDVSSSSSFCRWLFPIMMFCVFGEIVIDPENGFKV